MGGEESKERNGELRREQVVGGGVEKRANEGGRVKKRAVRGAGSGGESMGGGRVKKRARAKREWIREQGGEESMGRRVV